MPAQVVVGDRSADAPLLRDGLDDVGVFDDLDESALTPALGSARLPRLVEREGERGGRLEEYGGERLQEERAKGRRTCATQAVLG